MPPTLPFPHQLRQDWGREQHELYTVITLKNVGGGEKTEVGLRRLTEDKARQETKVLCTQSGQKLSEDPGQDSDALNSMIQMWTIIYQRTRVQENISKTSKEDYSCFFFLEIKCYWCILDVHMMTFVMENLYMSACFFSPLPSLKPSFSPHWQELCFCVFLLLWFLFPFPFFLSPYFPLLPSPFERFLPIWQYLIHTLVLICPSVSHIRVTIRHLQVCPIYFT